MKPEKKKCDNNEFNFDVSDESELDDLKDDHDKQEERLNSLKKSRVKMYSDKIVSY